MVLTAFFLQGTSLQCRLPVKEDYRLISVPPFVIFFTFCESRVGLVEWPKEKMISSCPAPAVPQLSIRWVWKGVDTTRVAGCTVGLLHSYALSFPVEKKIMINQTHTL